MPMNPRLLRPTSSTLDSDAAVYLNAVAQADGEQLEPAVRKAINDFVVGCKRDGIWDAIKASCILAGARTLAGALTPLKGAAPTNNGPFVSGDYNRETGLVGNGTSKYLDTNRNNNDDPQDSKHVSVWVSTASTQVSYAYFGAGGFGAGSTAIRVASNSNHAGHVNMATGQGLVDTGIGPLQTGFIGLSRSQSSNFDCRGNGATTNLAGNSATPFNENVFVYQRGVGGALFSSGRLAFYSVGEALNLASLDSRIAALITAIGAAI